MSGFVLSVPDMSCDHCVRRISSTLNDLDIFGFEVNLVEKKLILETSDVNMVIEALKNAGYPAFLVSGGARTVTQGLRRGSS